MPGAAWWRRRRSPLGLGPSKGGERRGEREERKSCFVFCSRVSSYLFQSSPAFLLFLTKTHLRSFFHNRKSLSPVPGRSKGKKGGGGTTTLSLSLSFSLLFCLLIFINLSLFSPNQNHPAATPPSSSSQQSSSLAREHTLFPSQLPPPRPPRESKSSSSSEKRSRFFFRRKEIVLGKAPECLFCIFPACCGELRMGRRNKGGRVFECIAERGRREVKKRRGDDGG